MNYNRDMWKETRVDGPGTVLRSWFIHEDKPHSLQIFVSDDVAMMATYDVFEESYMFIEKKLNMVAFQLGLDP